MLRRLRKCNSKKELEELEVDDGGTFKGSSCFIPATFLCCVLINARTNDTFELIPMVIHAGEEFDRENATLDEGYERAVNHVEFFVDCLWDISKNKVGVTNFLIQADQFPHLIRRRRNFKILRSTPQRLHHGVYQYSGERPTIDIVFS